MVDEGSDFPYLLEHLVAHFHNILGFLSRVPVIGLDQAHDHVAIADGVQLVDELVETDFVEFSEEVAKHVDDLEDGKGKGYFIGGNGAGVFCEACDVCEQEGDVLELVFQHFDFVLGAEELV